MSTNVAPKAPTLVPKPSRMSLASVSKGRKQEPIRALLFGPEGVGKSTFGANAPSPIFLGTEDGTSQIDCTRFPSPESWSELLEAITVLTNDAHDYKTLVVDTLDWAEPLLWAHICKRDGEKSVESYGYGRGYQAALDEWRVFLAALERLRRAKPMHVVLLAHSWIRNHKPPDTDAYDRYEMKLNAKASQLLKEWVDCVLFANYETFATKDDRTKRVRGISTGARLIHTERTGAYDAKNRYGLPETLPLSWSDFFAAVEAHQVASPEILRAEIERKAKQLGGDAEKKATDALARAGGDARKLAELNNWCSAKLMEKESQ